MSQQGRQTPGCAGQGGGTGKGPRGQALPPGLISIDKGQVPVRRQLKLMAGPSQGGAWAIKICSNTTLTMSVTDDQTVTKSPKCCVCSTGRSWGSWGSHCVWALAFVQEEALSEELKWEERAAQDSWAPLWSNYTSLCLSLEKNLCVARSSPRTLDVRCVLMASFTIWVSLPQTNCSSSRVQEPIPVLPERLLHFTATGWGSAGGAPPYRAGSWDCTCAGCGLSSDGSCDQMKPLTHRYAAALLLEKQEGIWMWLESRGWKWPV